MTSIMYNVIRRFTCVCILVSAVIFNTSVFATQLGSESCGGSGDLGANWTLLASLGAEMPQQSSGVCQPKTVNIFTEALYTAVSWPNDQYTQLKVVTVSTSTSRVIGTVLRGITSARTNYECQVIGPLGATTTLTIYRFNAGAPTVLAGNTATFTVASGDIMYCEIVGSTLTMKINGSTVLGPTVDGSPIASGTPGIVINTGNGVVTDAQTDDWAGGNFAGGSLLLMGVGQ